MRIAYEWLPDSERSSGHRIALRDALLEMARAMEDIAIQSDCQTCKRTLLTHVQDYRAWAQDLIDGRRRRVPMIQGSVQDWKDRGRPLLHLDESKGGR